MKIAFLYIAEAYQCYHAAAIAHELASRHGARVTTFYNDEATPHHLERIRAALGAEPLPARPLAKPWPARLLKRIGIFVGAQKAAILLAHRWIMEEYDAVVAVENTTATLRRIGVRRPKLVYIPHGYGDRARGFVRRIRLFDLVLTAGEKTTRRMLDEGLIRPGHYAVPGYVKVETAQRLRERQPRLFANDKPIVLYNPHKAPGLGSWPRFIEPMLEAFGAQDEFNLIVAPHVKMFARAPAAERRRWEARSTGNILIDTGSERSMDMTYTSAADLYIGDISSQVYEYLIEPRPCLFLNAHNIAWQDNRSFENWTLGDVVDRPEALMEAVRSAFDRHALYRQRQEELISATIGDRSPGVAARAADAIAAFLRDGRV
jgi:hypothetical protein